MTMLMKNNTMPERTEKHTGFLVTEVMMALVIVGALALGLAISLDAFARFNKYQMLRQRCIAAARAQLDSIAITGRPIDDEDLERLWPKISISFEKSQGTGQWRRTELLEVTATGTSSHRNVEVRLARYVLKKQDR